jgi:hypothetical protein
MTATQNLLARLDSYTAATRLRTAACRDLWTAYREARSELTASEAIEIESVIRGEA